ncbi:MAG: PDZ domain-containing protein [Planctomycetes bacterium]|nr:PDZ domain-containing protein [Planctomycetota bacterium]MCW8134737.1 PDZ domain-containing protein [Planctomycetota bacterium]
MHILQARPVAAEVDEQVKLLDHPNLDIRNGAQTALIALGDAAVPQLRKHLSNQDLSAETLDQVRATIKLLGGIAEPLERPRSELRIRVKSDSRSVEVSGSGSEVIVKRDGKAFKFVRNEDGSIRVEVRDGAEVKVQAFADAEDLRKSDAALHRELQGTPRAHGEANPADLTQEAGIGDGNARKDMGEVQEFLDLVDQLNFGDGDLSDEERKALNEKARQRLEKDMQKLQNREKDNAREKDPREDLDIKKSRHRASLKALERDLIYRVSDLRRPAGGKWEGTLDSMQDRIRDTFANLHDKMADGGPKDWERALEDGRKFHRQFSDELNKWAGEIGADAAVMDVPVRVTEMKKQLRDRLKRIRKAGPKRIENNLDDLEEKILASYERLEDKVKDTPPSGWKDILATAEKFFVQYSADLDKWAKEAGVDETVSSPLETIANLRQDLLERIAQVRRLDGEKFEDELDELEDNVKETFADLKDRVVNRDKKEWPAIQQQAEKHYKLFVDKINLLQRQIELGGKPKDSPDKDTPLPAGEHMDVVEGVRVARLLPLTRKQLGLDHGLSVNEIVDADKALARAGLEVYDIILEVNSSKVDSRNELRDAMNGIERGSDYTLKVMRGGKPLELKVKR